MTQETSQVLIAWFDQAIDMDEGNEIFLPCINEKAANSLKTRFYRVRSAYKDVDPVTAEAITFSPIWRDGKCYLKIKKEFKTVISGFMKSPPSEEFPEGEVTTIDIKVNQERKRTLLKMIRNNLTKKAIEKELGKLTEKELELIKGNKE